MVLLVREPVEPRGLVEAAVENREEQVVADEPGREEDAVLRRRQGPPLAQREGRLEQRREEQRLRQDLQPACRDQRPPS